MRCNRDECDEASGGELVAMLIYMYSCTAICAVQLLSLLLQPDTVLRVSDTAICKPFILRARHKPAASADHAAHQQHGHAAGWVLLLTELQLAVS